MIPPEKLTEEVASISMLAVFSAVSPEVIDPLKP